MTHLYEYFASKPADEVASELLSRANRWYNHIYTNGLLLKIRDSWRSYHGAYQTDFGTGHQITFDGEEGEIAQIAINHYRNIAQHILVMITANRPAMQARSINTDYKSLSQTTLANGLLDYYLREKRLEKYLKTAVEYAIVLSAGYIKMEWDASSGEIYDYNEETGTPVYEGDVKFSNLSPLDVVIDSSKENQDHDWVLCRSFKNKFDLAAKFPDLAQRIKELPTKTDLYKYKFSFMFYDETDDVPVYEFYHKRTPSMPDGRYQLFLAEDLTLIDTNMPYRNLPVYRISCADILGTPYGYTPMFDLIPIQDAINSLYTTLLTNNNTFGVQNILMPRGTDINPQSLAGGLNLIEYNAQAGKPEPLQMVASSPETYKFLEMLEKVAETISGISSVTRGNPEASLKSGTALALVQSMSLQFISGLQQSYVQMIEDVGGGLIDMLKDYASVPRIASIVGKSNKAFMKEFTGEDLSGINRVIVDVGNPLANTTAGRVQMAEQMLQMNLIKTPEQYEQVINTGKLDVMTENTQHQLLLIKDENEKLMAGQRVIATFLDEHVQHIKEHQGVIASPELREDPNLVQNVAEHVQQHIDLLRNTDPALLAILGQQALGPAGGTPPGPQQPPNTPDQGMGGAPQIMQGPTGAAGNPAENAAGTPSPAAPPPPFEHLPTNPAEMTPKS